MITADVAIAGAGIVGLSTALEFARRGLRVVVLERGRPMEQASWAAAGMLAARDPENPPALGELSHWSDDLYPEYLGTIAALSGQPVPFRTSETLQAVHAAEPANRTRKLLEGSRASALVPGINPKERFLLLPERSLDPRDLCAALPRAAQAAGVVVLENQPVAEVRSQGRSVQVHSPGEALSAGAFVNACGAWASHLPGSLPPDTVQPRKGQMVVVTISQRDALRLVLRTPEIYLVPRGDGRIVIGATVEEAGFDTALDPQAEAMLLERAAELWPPIAQGQVAERWAGLRPATTDGLPVIGAAEEPGCFVATGHFRNGILLAPATAHAVADLHAGKTSAVDLRPFSPQRLSAAYPL